MLLAAGLADYLGAELMWRLQCFTRPRTNCLVLCFSLIIKVSDSTAETRTEPALTRLRLLPLF